MTWNAGNDEEIGQGYLRLLQWYIDNHKEHLIEDVEGDDTDGRVTGEFSCGHCGMHSDDPEFPVTCCKPMFIRAGLIK